MEPEVRILKEQQKLKKKMIEKMEKQNKRYKEALELIESLIKDNEKLKFESNSTKKPKKQTKKKSPTSTKSISNRNNLNSFITNKEIVSIFRKYSKALQNGALGGKVLGSGGGGFLLFFVPKEKQHKIIKALKDLTYVPFQFENSGSKVVVYEPYEENYE